MSKINDSLPNFKAYDGTELTAAQYFELGILSGYRKYNYTKSGTEKVVLNADDKLMKAGGDPYNVYDPSLVNNELKAQREIDIAYKINGISITEKEYFNVGIEEEMKKLEITDANDRENYKRNVWNENILDRGGLYGRFQEYEQVIKDKFYYQSPKGVTLTKEQYFNLALNKEMDNLDIKDPKQRELYKKDILEDIHKNHKGSIYKRFPKEEYSKVIETQFSDISKKSHKADISLEKHLSPEDLANLQKMAETIKLPPSLNNLVRGTSLSKLYDPNFKIQRSKKTDKSI